jgi:lysophospholipase L1-like esterase
MVLVTCFDAAGAISAAHSATPAVLTDGQSIAFDHPAIAFDGVFFPQVDTDCIYLNRFSADVLAAPGGAFDAARAQTTSGAVVRFKTDSTAVTAYFREVPTWNEDNEFGIFQDGVLRDAVTGLTLTGTSANPGQAVTWELACPSRSNVAFLGLSIDAGASMLPLSPRCRPRYVAFGDSITHGTGQGSRSYQTYPWVLAKAKNWDMYNLGISGSKVCPTFGAMLDDEPIDVATVLWGQNDWNYQNNAPLYQSQLDTFLTSFRAHHPDTEVYMITLIANAKTTPQVDNGYTREDYRQVVRNLVSSRTAAGDTHIQVIEGEALTTTYDLADGTHLSVAGAASFGYNLYRAIGYRGGLHHLADLDDDGDVDQSDFGLFQLCLSGPGNAQANAECRDTRLDVDEDVDVNDLAIFQQCLTGADRSPACITE